MASAKNREGEHVTLEALDAEKTEEKTPFRAKKPRRKKKSKAKKEPEIGCFIEFLGMREKKKAYLPASVKLLLIIF